MTEILAGVVEVFLLRKSPSGIGVLVMRRAAGTRCTGAWEVVHGRIDPGEKPADAARREVLEESGLRVERLYSVRVHPFYLHQTDTVQLALVFAAFGAPDGPITLGLEHDAAEWVSPEVASERLAWPRSRAALGDVVRLLATGNAGPVEDVLLIPDPPSP